jgi:ankyrin repeat protein
LKAWVAQNDPLAVLPDGGLSLLKEACSCFTHNYDAADWPLRQGVDPTGPLKRGVKTPLQLADEANSGDTLVLLLEHGANPEHLDRDNHQPQQRRLRQTMASRQTHVVPLVTSCVAK